MSKTKKMLPYLLVCVLAFYITPLIGKDTGGFMFLLLIVVPIICIVVSIFYGIKNEFKLLQLLFPLFVGILFIPAVYIFYNESAWIYPIIYPVISLVGNGIGYGVAKLMKNNHL